MTPTNTPLSDEAPESHGEIKYVSRIRLDVIEGRLIFVLESDDLVGLYVRPDGTDMNIGSIETSDPGQKPVLGKVG
jgi:hypothetical protein